MAKERLSKLQKWIIKTCYERSQDGFMVSRKELSGVYLEDTNKIVKEASLSRSLWLLLEKGYITGLSPMRLTNMAIMYGMQGKSVEDFKKDYGHLKLNEKIATLSIKGFNKIKIIGLTEKGKEKTKELLNVK
ncbi:hypothetical protein A2814_01280 [Candidatus Nomurabacteria bacterium RIFCSPHIGHO2_01_FULL_38_19]|uniref:Uncharacterized protein n=1 Tax=Candidatus Nomurabacteria bacterium RIFCSPHIGHO2_01_FULL_38_19 TaxID=1801732 RepID=A0A1F6UQM5_9BACT|nr:MAG: hypothetical protein A2814_01280 [Candidatus Nomurabacteria bacterium RIFCSPHIGHO2_01_FULL_38_19]